MKVKALIELLKECDPNADVVSIGHRDFFYPVQRVTKMLLERTAVLARYHYRPEAIAYRDTMKSDQGDPCVDLAIER